MFENLTCTKISVSKILNVPGDLNFSFPCQFFPKSSRGGLSAFSKKCANSAQSLALLT